MNQHGDIGAQILSGIFIFFWLLTRPFVWISSFVKWFIVSVFKETGNTMVKIIASALAMAILGFIISVLSGKSIITALQNIL